MHSKPMDLPPNAILLRMHWQYQIKRDGTRRSRNCCDGSPRGAPRLHAILNGETDITSTDKSHPLYYAIGKTYSSCVDHSVQRLYAALSATCDHQMFQGDATDAYAHSPAPTIPTYIAIDDAYAEWYYRKYGITLN